MNPSPENTSALAQFLAEPGEDKQSSEFDKKRALEWAKSGLAAYQAQNRNDDPYYAASGADRLQTGQRQGSPRGGECARRRSP